MSKTVKFLLSAVLVLILLLAAMIAVPRYFMGIDIFDLSGWSTREDGTVVYLDYRGDPITGWQTIEEKWYYFSPEDGAMRTGWMEVDGVRYYLDGAGVRQTGWLELEDGTYYISPDEIQITIGWLELDEATYYFDLQGRKQTGWQDIGDDRYYLDQEGHLYTGWLEQDGNRYYLAQNGAMHTGWLETEAGNRYLDENGILRTGWTDTPEGRYYLTEEGTIATGWLITEEGTHYLDENGQIFIGWLELDTGKYYIGETGYVTTGWLDLEGDRYYFRQDGTMAVGKVVLDEQAFYFASTGKHVYMVNRWNPVPDDYQVDLVTYSGYEIAREAYEPLVQMLEQIKSLGYYNITSMYRNVATQQYIWNNRYNKYLAAGYGQAGALAQVRKEVADPGTSEHHLGLAVDIDGVAAVHKWLAEHSWEYGFIVRYPDGKTDITGIIYEPWHYRYVGKELAKELYELGLTLEEYMDMLTEQQGTDAGTASDPERE